MERIKTIGKIMFTELHDPYYQGVAGQLAFFLFLSILPTVALLSQILGLFSLSLEGIKAWANVNISASGIKMLENLIESNVSTTGGNIVLLLTTIWSASKAQYALSGVTDYINTDGEGYKYSYIRRRARSYVLIVVILVLIVLSLVFLVYAPVVIHLIFGENAAFNQVASALNSLRWIIVFFFYMAIISMVYYLTPSRRTRFIDILPGSIFSSIGFIAVTMIYSAFTDYSRGTNIIYGSMANVVVLLVWFWFISWVICLGTILNKACRLSNQNK